jgi:CBS domain containing-hemolysin-like protein
MMLGAVVAICLMCSFVLAGCEAALLAVSRVRVRHAANEGDFRARRLLPMIENRDAMLGAVTVANHVASLGAFLVIAWKLVGWCGQSGYALSFLIGLPIFLVGLEILPKKLFRRYPFRMLRLALPLLMMVSVFRPFFGGLVRGGKGAKSSGEVPENSVVRDDLSELAVILAKQGQVSSGASILIRNVLSYRRLRVRDVMVPLKHSVALAPDVPVHVAVELARGHGIEAVPVLGEDGSFVGVFEPALCGPNLPEDRMVRQHMRTLEQLSEGDAVLTALQRLRRRGRMVALAVTSGNVPCGVVTEEALLRPLLGES